MSGELDWVATCDDKDVIAALKRAAKEVEKYKDQIRALGEQTGKAEKETKSWLEGQISGLMAVATKMIAVGAIASTLKGAYREWRQEVEQVAAAHKDFAAELVKTVARSNDLMQGEKISKFLGNVKGATKTQALESFRGVTEGSPSQGLDKRLEIAAEAAKQAPTGIDLAQLANVAGKLGGLDSAIKPNDLVDMAVAMQQKGGENFEKFGSDKFIAAIERLGKSGIGTDRALGLGIAGIEANLPPGVIAEIAEKLHEKDPNAGKHPSGPMTVDERLKSQFYKMPIEERLASLTSNQEMAQAVLGAGGMLNLSALGDGKSQANFLADARNNDAAAARLKAQGGFEEGRQQLRDQDIATMSKGPGSKADAIEELMAQRAIKFVENKLTAGGSGFTSRWTRRAIMAAAGNAANVLGESQTDAILASATFRKDAAGPNIGLGNENHFGLITPQQRQEFLDKEKPQRELIAALRENAAALRRAPVKKNIDAHSE